MAITGEGIEREASMQTFRALDCGGAVSAHWDRVTIEADGKTAVGLRFERDVAGQPCVYGGGCCRILPRSLLCGGTGAGRRFFGSDLTCFRLLVLTHFLHANRSPLRSKAP